MGSSGVGSGGAPLPRAVDDAYRQAGMVILEGYGLTESSPVITFNRKVNNRIGTVGSPLPGVEVAIAPDGSRMGVTGREGTVLLRPSNVKDVDVLASSLRN